MKKTWVFTLIFLFIFSPVALGHSGLSSSSPKEGEIVQRELSNVSLQFNTTIENSSTLQVLDAEGQIVPIENFSLSSESMVGELVKPLAEGNYTVEWKIIGKDGHPIDGVFSFSVVLAPELNDGVSNEQNHDDQSHPIDEKPKVIKESKESNFFLTLAAILLIGIALGTAYMLFKKERAS